MEETEWDWEWKEEEDRRWRRKWSRECAVDPLIFELANFRLTLLITSL